MRECCHCKKCLFFEEETYGGIEYVEIASTRAAVVFDQYPPGDVGLGYACSLECFRAHVDQRDHA